MFQSEIKSQQPFCTRMDLYVMALPVALDCRVFFKESVLLKVEGIVSGTTNWGVFVWAESLDPENRLLFWNSIFSWVSSTATPTPVISQTSFLKKKETTTVYNVNRKRMWTKKLLPLWGFCVDSVSCNVLRCCREHGLIHSYVLRQRSARDSGSHFWCWIWNALKV